MTADFALNEKDEALPSRKQKFCLLLCGSEIIENKDNMKVKITKGGECQCKDDTFLALFFIFIFERASDFYDNFFLVRVMFFFV